MYQDNLVVQEGQTQHVCNPISHKCSCERGYTPVTQVVMMVMIMMMMMMIMMMMML